MSEVIFSDKYSPLFELLVAWDEVERLSSLKNLSKSQKEQLEYYTNLSNIDTVCLSGGRDSGKSFALSCFNVIACADYGHRILYTRQTMTSTKNSIKEAVNNRMEILNRDSEFEYADDQFSLIDKSKRGKITITGQKTSTGTQTARLKSLEDYSIFETEEAEELTSYDEWKKIKRSMRASDVQCLSILCFNPPTRTHWLAEEFYEAIPDGFNGIRDNVLYIHTDYLNNGQDNMAEHNWNEYEELRKNYEFVLSTAKEERERLPKKVLKNYEEYKYAILGGFKKKAEGVVYDDYEIGKFDETIPQKSFGLDFGSNDPDALTKVAIDKKRKIIYLKEEYFKNNTSYEGIREILKDRAGTRNRIVADCAERRMILDLKSEGLNIHKSDKSMPVKDQIKMLQDYEFVIDSDSVNLINSFDNYSWHDKKAGVPKHDFSDLMDSWRYAAYDIINPSKGAKVFW